MSNHNHFEQYSKYNRNTLKITIRYGPKLVSYPIKVMSFALCIFKSKRNIFFKSDKMPLTFNVSENIPIYLLYQLMDPQMRGLECGKATPITEIDHVSHVSCLALIIHEG